MRNHRSDRGGAGPAGSRRVRLFVALDLPADARERLAGYGARVASGRPELRPVGSDALHVTLVFLGARPEEEVGRIAATTSRALATAPAVHLEAGDLREVPPGRPRVLALDLADPTGDAVRVQATVAAALTRAGLHRPERRAFWPHVTVARVRTGGRRRGPEGGEGPIALEVPLSAFVADEVTLYRSRLRPDGAVYEPIERVRLGAGLR